MKKYFVFAAAALVAFASCSKVSPDVETPDEEITFQTANYSASTKADEGPDAVDKAHRAFYSTGTFGVYSYFTNDTPSATNKLSAGTEYMTNVAVSKRDSDGAYAPASTYYWPKAGKLSFVGYYPYMSTSPVTVTRGDATMTMAFNNYTVGTLSSQSAAGKVTVTDDGKVTDDQNDLMYADPSYGLSQQNPAAVHYKDGVPMLFHHMLAKVYFKVKLATLDENQVKLPLTTTLTAINVVKVAETGNATVNPATPSVTWTSTAPTASSTYDSGDFVATDTEIVKAAANTEAPVSFTSDMLYVLPQTLVNNVCAVTVDYKVNDEVIPTTTVNLQPITASWEPNKIYCYTITINPFSGEILFDPATEDWTNPVTSVNSNIN